MHFSQENIVKINAEYLLINQLYQSTLLTFGQRKFNSENAKEHFYQGFLRRLNLLIRCAQNINRICPPEQYSRLSRDDVSDLTIYLQAFIFNCFGCIDNLARVWVYENNILEKDGSPIKDSFIKFDHRPIKKSFSMGFRKYLLERREWFKYLQDYRHALAHRIPLYVPPYMLTQDEINLERELEIARSKLLKEYNFSEYEKISDQLNNLGRSSPLMKHSYLENSDSVYFQVQVIGDFRTIIEIFEKFIAELDSFKLRQLVSPS